MTLKNSIYLIILIILSGCETPIPEDVVSIKGLNIWVDEHEVTAFEFERFKHQFDIRIASDSTTGWWYSLDSLRWEKSSMATHLKPNSMVGSDSLSPAVQVSWDDACSYCNALNGRLPTVDEWEKMTQGEYIPGNIWEGFFPFKDEGKDGFSAVSSPVKSFSPNSNGLYDVHGNVWEWTSSKDAEGNFFVKSGSFLSDYNSGGFLPDYELALSHDSLRVDLGFRCVYNKEKH